MQCRRPGFHPWVGNICYPKRVKAKREWLPTPVFLPGGFHGQRSLVGYSPGGCKESEVAKSCQTLCHPMDCSPLGSSVHGIFQARVLEWVAISFRGSFQPEIEPGSPELQAYAFFFFFFYLSNQGSLESWGRKEFDTTKRLTLTLFFFPIMLALIHILK